MGAKLFGPEVVVLKFEYDFADLGGAVGTYSLGKMPEGFMAQSCVARVETALGGAGAFTAGVTSDKDGYFTDMQALTAGAYNETGALIGTNPHYVAANEEFYVEVSGAAVSDGKIQFYVIGFQA